MKDKIYHGKIFYGWYIVGAGVILMAVCWGITFNTASLFINPISKDLGISRQAINVTFSIRAITQLAIALLSGIIFTRIKLKNLIKVASITSVISLFLHSYVKSIASLYILTATSGISTMFLGTMPLSMIINNWFHEKNGTAIGLAFMGSGLGGMVFNSLAGRWILTYGWRTAYQFLALIVLATAVPIVFLVIKVNPREVGLLPLGGEKIKKDENGQAKAEELEGVTFAEARGTIKFWVICFVTTIFAMSGGTMMNNIAPHLNDINYSPTFSANIVALTMGSLALGKIILGYLFDRFGLRNTTFISSISIVIGFICLINADKYIALAVLVVCVGLGCAYLTVAYPVIVQTIFGRKDYSAIYGFLNAAHSIGGIISPLIVGYLFDRSGSYNSSFMVMMVFALIATVIYQFIFPKKEKILR